MGGGQLKHETKPASDETKAVEGETLKSVTPDAPGWLADYYLQDLGFRFFKNAKERDAWLRERRSQERQPNSPAVPNTPTVSPS